MKKSLIIISAIALTLLSCKDSKNNDAENNSEETTIEEITYTSMDIKLLLDSAVTLANSSWDSVTVADDNKMADIKRLLDEISYSDGADDKRLKELYAYFEEVKAMRYTQDNITGDLIDGYDAAQDSLISSVNALAESTPNIEAHPLAIELMDDIVKADGMTFSKRGDYDIWAKQINNTIKNHPELVEELGKPYTNYQKLGIFGFDD